MNSLLKVVWGEPLEDEALTPLLEEGLIRKVGDRYTLKGPGLKVLSQKVERDIKDNLMEYRKLFVHLGRGMIGEKAKVIKNLREFIVENNYKYWMKDIIEAASIHISKGGFNGPKYIRQADYFIKKTQVKEGEKEVISDLMRVLEEKELLGDEEYRDDDPFTRLIDTGQ